MVIYDPNEQIKAECVTELRKIMRECLFPRLTKIKSLMRWATKRRHIGRISEMWLRWRIHVHLTRAYKDVARRVITETPPDRAAIMNEVTHQNFEQEEKKVFFEFFRKRK